MPREQLPSEQKPNAQKLARPVHVLVVEDERIVARDIKACLEGLGYIVAGVATSGEEAIAKARDLCPNIVLMDIRLEGGMDGVEAAQHIWNELQIPVIYATGYSDTATVDRATDSELFGYILKPIKERDLYIAIKNALQRQHQQTSLIEQQRWVNTILKAIGDGVIVTNAQGQVKFLNLVAEALTGWTLEEAVNHPLLQVFQLVDEQSPHVPLENPVTEVLRTGRTVYLVNPVLLITKDGRQIPIADSAAPLKDNQGNTIGVVVVFRDVAERELVQERAIALQRTQLLESQMSELQRLSQLKDDFLGTVSHELRSPLANIKMSIHMLEMSLDRQRLSPQESEGDTSSDRITRYLKILRSECDQELNLVNDLLEIQRLEANATLFDWTPIVLSEWIPQVIEAYEGRAEQQQIQIRVMVSEDMPPLISDRTILTSAFSELLNNACKYTPPQGVIVISAQVETQPDAARTLRWIVSNTGIEILPNELPHVFDKFYRAPSLVNAASLGNYYHQRGTGLGLALVQKQIVCLGGAIAVQSDSGEVRFVIELPLTPVSHLGWQ